MLTKLSPPHRPRPSCRPRPRCHDKKSCPPKVGRIVVARNHHRHRRGHGDCHCRGGATFFCGHRAHMSVSRVSLPHWSRATWPRQRFFFLVVAAGGAGQCFPGLVAIDDGGQRGKKVVANHRARIRTLSTSVVQGAHAIFLILRREKNTLVPPAHSHQHVRTGHCCWAYSALGLSLCRSLALWNVGRLVALVAYVSVPGANVAEGRVSITKARQDSGC